jgi:hypothetical protein
MQYTELHNYLHSATYLVSVYVIKWFLRVYLHDCCSDPKFMEEIKHLKIETVTHIFPKFTRMQGNMFDSCMHSFFARMERVAHPTVWLNQCVGLNHVAG